MRHPLYVAAAGFCLIASLGHLAAIYYSLYWSLLWFDFPIHAAAGAMVGILSYLIASWVFSRNYTPYVAALLLVCVGFSWEVFEYVIGTSVLEPGFVSDTLQDFVADFIGGGLAIWWSHKRLDPFRLG